MESGRANERGALDGAGVMMAGGRACVMSSREVWGRVRERLRRFPELLASCGEQASVYGKCVASKTTGHGDLKKDVCAQEFEMLMDCFTKAAKKNVK